MTGKNSPQASNQANFVESAYWLANALAFIATILLMPTLSRHLGPYLWAHLHEVYSASAADFAYLLVGVGSWVAAFFALRMTFVTAFVAAAIGVAVRFV